MGARIRYILGICLQVIGLLNFVFLVGVPIWLTGRRLCRDARTDDRSARVVERRPASGDSLHSHSDGSDPSGDGGSSSAHAPEPGSERRVSVQRN